MKYFFLLCAILIACCVPPAAAVSYSYTAQWGSQGSGDGQFQYPAGIAVGASDEVYVADWGNQRAQRYDPDPSTPPEDAWMVWNHYDNYNPKYWNAVGDITAPAIHNPAMGLYAGDVYVSEPETGIHQYYCNPEAPTAAYLTTWTDPAFKSIEGLGISSTGYVYGADPTNNQVYKIDLVGEPVTNWVWGSEAAPVQFNHPTDVAVNASGEIYVTDTGNRRVLKFAPDGRSFEELIPQGSQFLSPWAIVTDASGNVFVTDAGSHSFHVFNADGNPVTWWDGSDCGGLLSPQGIAVDSGGNVYVSDRGHHRIVKFEPSDGPIADANGPYDGTEGSAVTFSAKGSTGSAGAAIVTYAWDFDNDGNYDATGPNPTHTWDDDFEGELVIKLDVTDANGKMASDTATVTIRNVAPTVVTFAVPLCPPGAPIRVGTPVPASVTFSDPGIKDTHEIVWNWGDGSTSTNESELDASGGLTNETTHIYRTPGIYSPSVTVTDNDGDEYTYAIPDTDHIVVYDPDAGSATGGGWFDDAGSKAHFAFVTKYRMDATTPESSVEFRIKPDLDFRSTACGWLVVGASQGGYPKATYRGVGTVNGASGYEFLLSAIDDPSGDRIRMKIWKSETVIYDNLPGKPDAEDPSMSTGGGNIVVHQ